MAVTLSEIIAGTPAGGTATLQAGEYEGAVTINRPMTLRGSNATIWAKHGSVITVASPGVTLEGLRVEITEGQLSETAIDAVCPVKVSDVEVAGSVKGFGNEDGAAELPRTIQLGEISAEGVNTFRMTVDIPAAARLVCDSAAISFQPENIPAGRSEIVITVTGSGSSSLLYAEVFVESAFRRRMYVCGSFSMNTSVVRDRIVFEAATEKKEAQLPFSGNITLTGIMPPDESKYFSAAKHSSDGSDELPEAELFILKKGQRTALKPYISSSCEIFLTGMKQGSFDIDPYVFMLNEKEQSFGDGGLVFFGNEASPDGSVRYHKDDGRISVDFTRVDDNVKRITLAYSVYSGNTSRNFSLVKNPRISVCVNDRERMRFDISGLSDEITIVAVEFYIYKGEWRISAVGSGYRNSLVSLCRRYGIEASE